MDFVTLGCCTLAFVLYINTLNAGFVYDDRRAILANTDVSDSSPWQNVFTNDYWGTPLVDSGSHGSYRPLCVLSFRLNFMLGGHTARGFHLINNLLHCLATGLVVRLARHFFSSMWGVMATGALFAAHPIHTEAVAGIVGRADLAACIFYLLTFLTYVRHVAWREQGDQRHWCALILTIVLSLVALLFKETAITALLVCCLYDILRGNTHLSTKYRNRSLCILIIALMCTMYWRLFVLPRPQTSFSKADNPIAKTNSLWTRFLTFMYLPVFNFKLLIYPQVLSFDWGMDAIPRITSVSDGRNFLSLFFYGTLVAVLWRSCKVLLKQKNDCFMKQTSEGALFHRYSHHKSRTKKKYMSSHRSSNYTVNSTNKYHYEATTDVAKTRTAAHLPYTSSAQRHTAGILTSDLCSFCHDCKQELSSVQHTSSCRVLNNNNNNTLTIGVNVYSDCRCHQLLSSKGGARHLLSLALHKVVASVTPRSSRSSSSCSNSTTASNKSFASSSSNSSSASSQCFVTVKRSHHLFSDHPPHIGNACFLLMTIALLVFPFLPATNLFFYVGFVVGERLLYLPSVGYCLLVGFGIAQLMDSPKTPKGQTRRVALVLAMCIALSAMSARTVRRNLDWRDEESLYRSAVAVNPPKALGNLGSVLSSLARYEEAKEVLLEAIKYRPNMADAHYNLGVVHQNQENFDAAVECFQRAISFRPNLAVAYLNLGASLIALGKCKEAALILQEGTKLDGTGVRDRVAHENARISSYLLLGALYVDRGKLQCTLAP